jgi:hypothetical protein
MWEIYTGKVPLTYNDETYEDAQDDLMDRCAAGFLPDMQLIDDPGVASLINSYIAAGPDRPDVCDPSPTYCVETRFVFGRCTAEPRHIYSRTVHSNQCVLRTDRGSGPCADPFVDPKVFSTPLEPICTKCNVGVEYTGLLP